jgi:hypothetical protein
MFMGTFSWFLNFFFSYFGIYFLFVVLMCASFFFLGANVKIFYFFFVHGIGACVVATIN